jgi:hypothetical protein
VQGIDGVELALGLGVNKAVPELLPRTALIALRTNGVGTGFDIIDMALGGGGLTVAGDKRTTSGISEGMSGFSVIGKFFAVYTTEMGLVPRDELTTPGVGGVVLVGFDVLATVLGVNSTALASSLP